MIEYPTSRSGNGDTKMLNGLTIGAKRNITDLAMNAGYCKMIF
jgi:hypothetical protein